MRKVLQKYLYGFFATVLLAAVFIMILKTVQGSTVSFYVDTDDISCEISVYDAGNGENYIFLPSYAKLEDIGVSLPGNIRASLNGIPLENGMTCGKFELNRPYDFIVNDAVSQKLTFLKSKNVATMYIDTPNESMEQVHRDKDNMEYADITLFTAEGILDFRGEGCGIKGRGNATWSQDKKPYTIVLPRETNLMGMGDASKWVLLANSMDESNLHNKIVFDFAREVTGLWIPDCVYVDVYLNGNYNGLYLLCEKVEVADGRLELDTESGDFLGCVEINSRWDVLKDPFISKMGRTIEISEPEVYTEEQKQRIQNRVDMLEKIISSGMDLQRECDIDQGSWIDRYLIDEIFANIDSDLCSSYFYSKDGVFYAGPLWDYDMVLGNRIRNINANSFVAKNVYKSTTDASLYNGILYQNEGFYTQMVNTYKEKYLPVLQNFMDYPIVASALTGINAIVCALLSHTVITLGKKSLVNVISVVLFIIGLIACFVFDITPILLVIFGGVVGVVYNKIKEVKAK